MTINTNNEFVTRQEFDALESLVKVVVASMNIQEVNKGFTYQMGEKLSKKESELR